MVIKANWDAAVDVHSRRVGVGVIIKNSERDMLVCLCSNVGNLMKSIVLEALALRRAMVSCLELGLLDVILEGEFSYGS